MLNDQNTYDPSDDPLAPEAIETDGNDLRGTTFVIPLDAPLPNELADLEVPSGTLYQRLTNLAQPTDGEFTFIPLTGSELLSLDRVWRQMQVAKKIAVLRDLPGARYDVIFDQAQRQIGLRTVEWPVVSEAMARRIRTVQRTADIEPWNLVDAAPLSGITTPPGEKTRVAKPYKGTNLTETDRHIPTPDADEEEL